MRPSDEAGGLEPLPKGWLKLPSSRWPGAHVYMHPARPALHLGWRPKPIDYYETPELADAAIKGKKVVNNEENNHFSPCSVGSSSL